MMDQKSNVVSGVPTSPPQGGAMQGIIEEAKHAAGHVADQAREQVETRITTSKDRAVETIAGVAKAVREAGSHLENAGPLPEVANRAAEGIERVATYFRDRDVGEIASDVESFARREPALFLGGLFALGLVGGRFLKSGTPRPPARPSGEGGRQEGSSRPAGVPSPFAGGPYGGPGYVGPGYEGRGYGGTGR